MKSALLFLLLFFSLCFNLLAQSMVQTCSSTNHIFLIHGIGGSPKSFGSLEDYLNQSDECYRTQSFHYDTGNSDLTTNNFMESFHQLIVGKMAAGLITPQDKISLIMHSQGGIVGHLWLDFISQQHLAIFNQVDAFITLSTPHWGSEMANVGERIFFTLPQGMDNPLSPFGRLELNEMQFGSSTIKNLSWSFTQAFRPAALRPLALGGIHMKKRLVIGENDAVVPLYSSRPDHYSGQFKISLAETSGTLTSSSITKTNNIPFIVVPATHLKMDLPGISTIPEKCLKDRSCDHPALPVIENHLKGRSIASVQPELSHFRTTLYINNFSDESFRKSDMKLEVLEDKAISIPLSQKLIGYRGKADLNHGVAFTFHGHTKKTGMHKVKLRFKLKNKLERILEVPVEGGYSSIVNLHLVR